MTRGASASEWRDTTTVDGWVRRHLDTAPDLTAAQRDLLVRLLTQQPGQGAGQRPA